MSVFKSTLLAIIVATLTLTTAPHEHDARKQSCADGHLRSDGWRLRLFVQPLLQMVGDGRTHA